MPDFTPPARDPEPAPVQQLAGPDDAFHLPDAFFSGIIAISADAIIFMDDSQRIILFNRGAERIFGYSAAEVMGQPLDVLLPERIRTIHHEHIEPFGASPIAAWQMGERGEIVGQRKSGEIFPAEPSISKLDVEGRRIYTAMLRDISERKRAEAERSQLLERANAARAAAEAAEQRAAFLADASALLDRSLDYETTLQSLADLVVPALANICFIDVIEGVVVKRVASAADAALTDKARALHQFPRRSDKPYLLRDAVESGRAVLVRDATHDALASVAQHPEHLRLLLALQPRSYITVPLLARGRSLGAIALIAAGEGRRHGQADLAFAEKLARRAALAVDNARLYGAAQRATQARDEILGIVAHDLRNPLSAIAMCASALDEGLESPPERVRYLVQAIHESSDSMNRLIQDLLDIATVETEHLSLELRSEPVAPLLAQLEAMFAAGAEDDGVRLVVEGDPDLPPVLADRERILQVLANLVANALKFTPAGGRIHVYAEIDASDGALVRFIVSDTGRGIPAEHLPYLFDRFWQARRNSKERGTGLGLAISKGIVEAHGGRIGVESTVDVGSVFSFVIPLASRARVNARPSRMVPESERSG